LSNRAKYILATLDGSVDLRKKNAQRVKELMISKEFDQMDGNYNYLIKMPMDSVTEENVEKILKEKTDAEKQLNKLKKTTLETMWLTELETLQTEYKKYQVVRENIQKGSPSTSVKKVKKRVIKKTK
jgi:DNA topoisomerase-2